ncbi:bifunctional 2',3'-cyclic-nucleotide 2'-phosphodiesterase/3'-nucleotidase [Azospirillum canadense]|uniref:bifunctional 2',3'-cyclic-nucleotide 2'-phosphodiesterase/3'-nucleotidase n=1 Tax=Azospirillum canadense TaxID=403962 RepID=UPI002225E014|nr:bifunctional 2',3'-cyclic-nucleotide 2'-phosphodiesterase/3'-nucleotidase [Azospirillum canadense]MCW2237465.1 2',3'-cyclic-nucleotide 2'-phosphodiesterase/3'-nucleotidase [Azospirillum canadense]
MKPTSALFALALAASTALTAPTLAGSALAAESTVKLRILETSDLHDSIFPYNYYSDKEDPSQGLARTATLIRKARAEAKNTLLFGDGDTIQGNPLGDYVAREKGLKPGEVHPVYKALNQLDYTAGTLGNHEFNYGLDFLATVMAGAAFPIVSANVYRADGDADPSNDKPYFEQYRILESKVIDEAGKEQVLKVGVIGFAPPQIVNWDKSNLQGKAVAHDIVETAKALVPRMRAEGADLVVALAHSGLSAEPPQEGEENAAYHLTQVEGLDALLTGHQHNVFPGPIYAKLPGADIEKGTVNGKPVVMPGFWGSHLGVVDLVLEKDGGKWKVADAQTATRPISELKDKQRVALVDSDPEVEQGAKAIHEETLAYVRKPVGETTARIQSYFALVQDDPSIQIVTNAQTWYVQRLVKGTDLEKLPILSAGAPFKAGGRGGADYYTDVPAGPIAIRNAADLYLYPNTLRAVVVTGDEVRDWLEMSAGMFNTIDPKKTEEQPLLNAGFPSFNFDVIDGVTYEIDLSQPWRYDMDGKVVHPEAHRIKNLAYQGKPIDGARKFLVATNNYRAGGGGKFPALDGKNIAIEAPDENRTALISYIYDQKTINPSSDGNWTFARLDGNPLVTFESSPKAKDVLPADGRIAAAGEAANGFAKYAIKFGK